MAGNEPFSLSRKRSSIVPSEEAENTSPRQVNRAAVLAGLVRTLLATQQAEFLARLVAHVLAMPKMYPLTPVQVQALTELQPWIKKHVEKAPAAICRKVVEAKIKGQSEIEIWGTGEQTRSFMYIDDCLKGIHMILESDILEAINLGSSEAVTINQLVDLAEEIAGIKLQRKYDLSAPKGVNGRNSDNTRIQQLLHWEPNTPLRAGLEKTYRWIYDQYLARERGEAGVVREVFTLSN